MSSSRHRAGASSQQKPSSSSSSSSSSRVPLLRVHRVLERWLRATLLPSFIKPRDSVLEIFSTRLPDCRAIASCKPRKYIILDASADDVAIAQKFWTGLTSGNKQYASVFAKFLQCDPLRSSIAQRLGITLPSTATSSTSAQASDSLVEVAGPALPPVSSNTSSSTSSSSSSSSSSLFSLVSATATGALSLAPPDRRRLDLLFHNISSVLKQGGVLVATGADADAVAGRVQLPSELPHAAATAAAAAAAAAAAGAGTGAADTGAKVVSGCEVSEATVYPLTLSIASATTTAAAEGASEGAAGGAGAAQGTYTASCGTSALPYSLALQNVKPPRKPHHREKRARVQPAASGDSDDEDSDFDNDEGEDYEDATEREALFVPFGLKATFHFPPASAPSAPPAATAAAGVPTGSATRLTFYPLPHKVLAAAAQAHGLELVSVTPLCVLADQFAPYSGEAPMGPAGLVLAGADKSGASAGSDKSKDKDAGAGAGAKGDELATLCDAIAAMPGHSGPSSEELQQQMCLPGEVRDFAGWFSVFVFRKK